MEVLQKSLNVWDEIRGNRVNNSRVDSFAASHADGAKAGYQGITVKIIEACTATPETPDDQIAQSIVDNL